MPHLYAKQTMEPLKDSPRLKSRYFPLLLLGFGLILISSSLYFILQYSASQPKLNAVPVEVNFPAPDLTLTDIEGRSSSLTALRGQVVLVNLWATWCTPCKAEMPALESFYRKYRDDGFTVVAVNDGDPASDVIRFVKEYGLTFPVWLDPTYIATEQAFRSLNLPSSYVINREGMIVLRWVGGINKKNLEQYVAPVILE